MLLVQLLFASAATAQALEDTGGEVKLGITAFGVGGLAREGDWAGIQVQMQDLGSTSRDIVLRIEIPDEDGDITQYDRVVTANPGVVQSFWLYAWLPFGSQGREYTLKAYEAIDAGEDDGSGIGFRAGRLLGQLPADTQRVQPPIVGMMGIIGTNALGLDQYAFSVGSQPWMPLGHELLTSTAGLGIENLPDRWQGLAAFNTIVWTTSTTAPYDPTRLTPEKARAIREWVQRGGHLVIVLQSAGDPWFLGSHPLRSLLPLVHIPERRVGVSLEPYRPLLTEHPDLELPESSVVHSFTPLEEAEDQDAMPVLQGPDGETLVVRRLLGTGMVSVVGLPLSSGQLRRLGLPEPEPFWHRVLGLRGEVPRPDQLSKQQKSDALNRDMLLFDNGVGASISKTGTAMMGVLFGIVVFVAYWLLAGPLGFMALKMRKLTHHAWLAFIVCIAAFTAIAWLGATALRPKRASISHFTIVQEVYGQEKQRARSWMSVMLPTYGRSTISSVDPSAEADSNAAQRTNLLYPWEAPTSGVVLSSGFPDNTGYRVQAREPTKLFLPTRATVKHIACEWGGRSAWRMPYVVSDFGAIEEPRLTIEGQVVSGQVAHGLPGPLKDVRVFVVSRMAPINRPEQMLGRRPISRVMVYAPSFGEGGWPPDTALQLRDVTSIDRATPQSRVDNFFESAIRYGEGISGITTARGSLTDRIVAGLFISQFEPPRYGASSSDPVGDRLAVRRVLHGWDMGRWFTQPSIIITGVLEISEKDATPDGMPVPVWVDGRRVPASGTTVVTWVYPLEPDPPENLGAVRGQTPPAPDSPASAEGQDGNEDD